MSVEEYRSFTSTQSSYTAHHPNGRHPYAQHPRHQNRGHMQGVRPRSPFAYPTRLKRPGYRPSSPSLSLNRSIHSNDLDLGNGSRTASPASMYNLSRIPTPWQQVVNRSDPTLRYYPTVPGLPSSRGSTPKPSPSVDSMASSIRLSQQLAVHYPGAWPVTPTITPPPLFYDYSEAFEEQTAPAEETHVHRISVSIVTTPVSPPDEEHFEYWERPQNVESEYFVELPSGSLPAPIVELNVFRSENSRPHSLNGHQHATPNKNEVPKIEPVEIADTSPLDLDKAISPSSTSMPEVKSVSFHAVPFLGVDVASPGSKQQQPSDSSEGQRSQGLSITEPAETKDESHHPQHRDLSPIASVCSVQSSVHGDTLEDSTAPTSGADTADASPEGPPRKPINQPKPAEGPDRPTHARESDTMKTSISMESIRLNYPEIIAPNPERSMVSLSSRERFSRILGLDQGLHELDRMATSSRRQGSIASYVSDLGLDNDERILRCLSPTPTTRNVISEEQEENNSTGLTYSLMDTSEDSDLSVYVKPARKSSSISPRLIQESSRPSTVRESTGWVPPTPSNVRLSHRRIVINAGQTIETKNETVYRPLTIVEDEVQEPSSGSFPKEPLPTDVNVDTVKLSLSIKAFAPPKSSLQSELPFAFTPLIQPSSDDESSADHETNSSLLKCLESQKDEFETTPPGSDKDVERVSTASPDASRPWNLDASYPWDDDAPPQLDVVMPLREGESLLRAEKVPRFRLRIQRASSSIASKLTKKKSSSEDTTSSVIASSIDLLKSASFRRVQHPRPSIGPGDCNSSHDIIGTSSMQTRFIESFEQPSLISPISLMAPSPSLDVRSFFSDDSSQGRPKGSIRKRFSHFRARNSRANSVDQAPGSDRGILPSAFGLSRPSGRSSRQSQTNSAPPHQELSPGPLRWTIFARLRLWFSRREDDIRHWKRKKSPAHADGPQLYTGV